MNNMNYKELHIMRWLLGALHEKVRLFDVDLGEIVDTFCTGGSYFYAGEGWDRKYQTFSWRDSG